MEITTKEHLQALIDSAIGEHTGLEYKAAPAIEDKGEIGKDVSAMANASGGIIIYGMTEVDNKPGRFDPIINKSREYLDQVIANQVRPSIQCNILPIDVPGGVIYIVKIPQGETAYQAKKDGRYHRRRNFTIQWMEDYEIRDIMNRSRNPKVDLIFRIKDKSFHPFLINDSDVLATHIRCTFDIPSFYIRESWSLFRDLDGTRYYSKDFYNENVLHPRSEIPLAKILPNQNLIQAIYDKTLDTRHGSKLIFWKVWADNAPVREGSIDIAKVKILDFNSY